MDENCVYHDELDKLRELFIGESVKKISDDRVQLSNGTVLRLAGNEGCGGCANGNYKLEDLNEGTENAITNIEVREYVSTDDDYEPYRIYRLFVYAPFSGRSGLLASFEGTDGNGYYGTGFHIEVNPEGE